ncbi:MAG: hypothetical protein VB934_03430 [Polyangiaceae bacterium]
MPKLLEALGAPPGLLTWLIECENEADPPWETCGRADWILWIAACQGADFFTLLRTSVACVRLAISASVGPTQRLHQAMTVLEDASTFEDCERAAELCHETTRGAPASYRTGPGNTFQTLIDASESLVSAAKVLCALAARRQAQSQLDALHRATAVGVPPILMEAIDEIVVRVEPHRLDEAPSLSEEAAFLSLLGQAVGLAAKALPGRPSVAAQREAEETLADEVYDRLYGG